MRFAIKTFGCKVNQYESLAIASAMRESGFEEVSDEEEADIVIINSCTVTVGGDKKARQSASKIKRRSPEKLVVLTGCYPQAFPEEAAASGADIVTGNGERGKIAELVKKYISDGAVCRSIPELPTAFEEMHIQRGGEKTRAFIKIEDGCNRFCSYCIIPYARGRVRSRSLESILSEARQCAAEGFRELVLVGINLSCYGTDCGLSLADAVEAACSVEGIERVRLSSLEPELLDEKMLSRLAKQDKLCPHFHLSLQSGCDETLRRMNRRYTCEEYAEIVENIRHAFSGCSITTDMMAGFAGETEEEFLCSLEFAERIGFAKIHAFAYSVREGTTAAKRTDHVPEQIRQERFRRLSALDEKLHAKFLREQVGTVQPVLIQKRISPDYAAGLTPNYTPVRIYGSGAQRGSIIKTKIIGAEIDFCLGEEQ